MLKDNNLTKIAETNNCISTASRILMEKNQILVKSQPNSFTFIENTFNNFEKIDSLFLKEYSTKNEIQAFHSLPNGLQIVQCNHMLYTLSNNWLRKMNLVGHSGNYVSF